MDLREHGGAGQPSEALAVLFAARTEKESRAHRFGDFLDFMFDFRAIFVVELAGLGEDRLMEVALEAGAEDVITDDDGAIEVLTAPADFEAVKAALEAAGLAPELAEVTMRAENPVALAGEDAQRMQKLLDVIEDLDDVQAVYHNAALD